MSKKTVILGASTNPQRYAYLAAQRLTQHKHTIIPIGIKSGNVFGEEILDLRKKPIIKDIDTVTLYLGPKNQKEWEEYILDLNPKRIIFNPGTENKSLEEAATQKGIESIQGCTLVMLSADQY